MAQWSFRLLWPSRKQQGARADLAMNTPSAATAPAEGDISDRGYRALPGIYDEMTGHNGEVAPAWRACARWFERTGPRRSGPIRPKDRTAGIRELLRPPTRDESPGVWIYSHSFSTRRPGPLSNERQFSVLSSTTPSWPIFMVLRTSSRMASSHPLLFKAMRVSCARCTDLCRKKAISPSWPLDFARDPQGNWRVIDTHTETPAGHGFALANRMVLSEVAGRLFRQSNALRIGPFYQGLINDLLNRAGG